MMTRQGQKLKEFENVLQKVFGANNETSIASIKDKFTNFIQITGNTTSDYYTELKEQISKLDPSINKNNEVQKPKDVGSKKRASSKKRNNKTVKKKRAKTARRVKNELFWLPDIKFVRELQKDECIEIQNLPETFWTDLSSLPDLTDEDFIS